MPLLPRSGCHRVSTTDGGVAIFLRELLRKSSIDAVFLFGDCRTLSPPGDSDLRRVGHPGVGLRRGLLAPRPHHLEKDGVNGNSRLPKDPDFYRHQAEHLRMTLLLPPWDRSLPHGPGTRPCTPRRPRSFPFRYPRYRHHRNVNAFWQAFCWVRGGARKLKYERRERGIPRRAHPPPRPEVLLRAAAVHCDAQLPALDYAAWKTSSKTWSPALSRTHQPTRYWS